MKQKWLLIREHKIVNTKIDNIQRRHEVQTRKPVWKMTSVLMTYMYLMHPLWTIRDAVVFVCSVWWEFYQIKTPQVLQRGIIKYYYSNNSGTKDSMKDYQKQDRSITDYGLSSFRTSCENDDSHALYASKSPNLSYVQTNPFYVNVHLEIIWKWNNLLNIPNWEFPLSHGNASSFFPYTPPNLVMD